MNTLLLLCIAAVAVAAASDSGTGSIAVYGAWDSPTSLDDVTTKPVTVLVPHDSDPATLIAHRLAAGLEGPALRTLISALPQPAGEKVAVIARPSQLADHVLGNPRIVLPRGENLKIQDLAQWRAEPYLLLRARGDVSIDTLKSLGELEVLDGAVRVARPPHSVSLFPLRYYNPLYLSEQPLWALSYPYSQGGEYQDDDDFIYSHPAVKPVAIVPGDEYATYYPSTYPILSTVPVVPAPPPPAVIAAPVAVPIAALPHLTPKLALMF